MASEVRFADIKAQLEEHGWQHVRTKGSHHIFTGEGRPLVSIPVHRGKVKAVYARKVAALIAELEGA